MQCKNELIHLYALSSSAIRPDADGNGTAKIPGVSSCDETQPAPPSFSIFFSCGQSASKPSHTPRQDCELQDGFLPIVSAALAIIDEGL